MNHLDSLRFGFERQPAIVHRLDRDTSGCLLLARNPRSQKRFAQAFEAGTVAKSYLAVIDGIVSELKSCPPVRKRSPAAAKGKIK